MFHIKRIIAHLSLTLIACGAFADSQRTVFTTENRFPRWEQFEVGAFYNITEVETSFDTTDLSQVGAYVRYGVRENLALSVAVPYREIDPPFGESESGLGDIQAEFQLRTYEDIFGYPYFIPYLRVELPTGDEDKGLGAGDTILTPGMAYGGKINDWIDWVLDVGYIINPNQDNQFVIGHSYVWNVSEEFALITELLYQEEGEGEDDSNVIAAGGFSYHWTRNFRMGIHAGTGVSGPVDAFGQVRFSYSF